MHPKFGKALVILLMLLMAVLTASACTSQAPAANLQPGTPTVILITQVVTQIIAPTPAPVTPTAVPPTEPPPQPTATATKDPLSAPIYYPLEDCIASRLHIGDRAQVSLVGGANGIRYGRDLSESTVFAYAQPGSILEIVNGPWCSRGWLVWMVRTADGQVGYTPEGDGNSYWLFPAP